MQRPADGSISVLEEQLAELAEVILEPARRDDLDDASGVLPAFHIACICPRGLVM